MPPVVRSGLPVYGAAVATVLPLLCETGRCRVRFASGERPVDPVGFDPGEPWKLHVRVNPWMRNGFVVDAVLRRPGEQMELSEPAVLHDVGILLARGRFARFDHGGAFALAQAFRQKKQLEVPAAELPDLLQSWNSLPRRPECQLPKSCGS